MHGPLWAMFFMTDNNKEILPGWTLKVDEVSAGAYRITLIDQDGRKAEVVDDYNDLTLDKCTDYAFEIEKQTTRTWNKFLYDFASLRLKSLKLHEKEYHDKDFGSWTIQTKDKRLLLDGRDGRLIYEEKQQSDWVDKETIKDFRLVTLEQFKNFTNKIA
jgi:hypothetical protein